MSGHDDISQVSRDYPAWTVTRRYLPAVSGPGATVYEARRAPDRTILAAYSLPSLRRMITAYETGDDA